jgi:hypothetical protein
VVAPLEMKEGTASLGARAQLAIARAAVLYKPRLATFTFFITVFVIVCCWNLLTKEFPF